MCDLGVKIEGSILEARIARVLEELGNRDILLTPDFWLSDDWFTPEGVTGTAIPFYLAHPRLMRLERSMMGEVEGGTERWCMMLLRHEMGHVVDHAFLLHTRRRWQQLFGRSSYRYPRFYRPNPFSKRHVQHLEYWYAQSHPDEDFAETFAVWLQPRSGWRKRYRGWPALKKLEYVDELMAGIAGKKPRVRHRQRVDSLPTLKKKLWEHYQQKRAGEEGEYPNYYDQDLKKLFPGRKTRKSRSAASMVRRLRTDVLKRVAPWTGNDRYLLEHVLKDIIGRCRELDLQARGPESEIKTNLAVLLTKHAMNSLYRNRRWVEM